MSDMVNIVTLRARAGRSEALGSALRELVGLTRQEPGCGVCELHRSGSEEELWMVYERWRGRAAFEAHMAQPYVKAFLARLDELVGTPVDIQGFEPTPLD